MAILLTGHTGFVGQHVQQQLQCVPLTNGQGQPIDITDRDAVFSAVNHTLRRHHPVSVIHLAAQSNVPAAFADPAKTYKVNFFGTFNLLSALENAGYKGRLLFVGSGDVYGTVPTDDLPVTEKQLPRPRNPYAVSKVAAEALCFQWSQTSAFEIVMARPFNHIGPGQSDNFAISAFARQVVEIRMGVRPHNLNVGDIDVTRDFTDVRDIVRAYGLLLEHGVNGDIYNVGSGTERSMRSMLERLMSLTGIDAAIVTDPSRLRPAEQRRMRARCDKLTAHTGWKPMISIDQSLIDILEYWKRTLAP